MFSTRSIQPAMLITSTHPLSPEAALEKALAQPESAAALDNTLLKNSFLDAAKNERFQTTYFKEFKQTERYMFRERLRQDDVFQHCLSQRFKHDIANQQKISRQPDTFWEQMKFFPTVNQNERGPADIQITHIILHHTETNSAAETVKIMADRNVSAHYLIDRDGDLICLVPDNYQAWHAGVSKWQEMKNVNFCSIGIELVNNGFEPFPNEQIDTLLALLEDLKDRHAIPIENFISHADISPGRKVDPNWFFPWDLLGNEGFGLWLKPGERRSDLPENFDSTDALTTLGYQVEPLRNAIQAFNLHYLGHKEKFELDEEGKLTLHSLVVKVCGRVEDSALHVKVLGINDFA